MKMTRFFFPALALVAATAAPTLAQTEAMEAEKHLRKACEVVWSKATSHQVERCTQRAMAALADENRLRDNELKRLLVDSERDLQACTEELHELRGDSANEDSSLVAKKRRAAPRP